MRITKKFPSHLENLITNELKSKIGADFEKIQENNTFQIEILSPLKRDEENIISVLETNYAIENIKFKPFDEKLASFKRNRYSVTQGEYQIYYNDKLITTSKGQSNWGDSIELKSKEEDHLGAENISGYSGYSDAEILNHIERVYNNGDIYNGISALKYDYPVIKKDFILFNSQKPDEYHILKLESESEIYDFAANYLDNSKKWIYHSVENLLSIHKKISDIHDWDYEFHYVDDIVNNERGFQEILRLMDRFPDIKIDTNVESVKVYDTKNKEDLNSLIKHFGINEIISLSDIKNETQREYTLNDKNGIFAILKIDYALANLCKIDLGMQFDDKKVSSIKINTIDNFNRVITTDEENIEDIKKLVADHQKEIKSVKLEQK